MRVARELQEAELDEGHALPVADDEVVDHGHLDHRERADEPVGNDPVRLARLRHAGRVIMWTSA